MKLLLQRVSRASVRVGGSTVSSIGPGYLALLGVAVRDTKKEADILADKMLKLRVMPDEAGKMNRSVVDTKGDLLIVSQFTLYGDTNNGRRPSFVDAAPPTQARELYEYFVERVRASGLNTGTGVFQTHMEVELVNDGPVTFILEC